MYLKEKDGDGRMVQWSEHLLLFQKIWVQFPASTWELTTICNVSPKGANVLVWLLGPPSMYMVQMYMVRNNTHANKYK